MDELTAAAAVPGTAADPDIDDLMDNELSSPTTAPTEEAAAGNVAAEVSCMLQPTHCTFNHAYGVGPFIPLLAGINAARLRGAVSAMSDGIAC